MPKNPPENMPRITPAVFYDDPAAALDWLAETFGFEVRESISGPDGGIEHAELELADGVVMVGPTSARAEWKSPRSLKGSVTQGLYVYVDDVDAHFARAREKGAKIVTEPEDKFFGDRNYEAQDLEGHRWVFAQHVRDVAPEEMPPSD
jgi:uncharacterized glyoxalase superfamily protein PhnB